jgi:hypothetical protein
MDPAEAGGAKWGQCHIAIAPTSQLPMIMPHSLLRRIDDVRLLLTVQRDSNLGLLSWLRFAFLL